MSLPVHQPTSPPGTHANALADSLVVPQSDVRTIRKNWRPFLLSLLTHVGLMVALLLFGFWRAGVPGDPAGQLRPVGIVLTAQQDSDEVEYFDQELPSELQDQPQESEASPAAAAAPPALSPLAPPTDLKLPGLVGEAEFDASQMANVAKPSTGVEPYELSDSELALIRADRQLLKSRKPRGDATTIQVFGSGGLTGRSFVFVLDRSKSMGAGGLDVIDAARRELAVAIGQLESNHAFQVIGYNNKTVTLSVRALLDANEENKGLVAGYIGDLAAFGATNHYHGLMAAASFRPDIVVLLTDGGSPELNSGELQDIMRVAPDKCQFHCLQFGAGALQQPSRFMTSLADQTGGSYRYIDVRTWEKN